MAHAITFSTSAFDVSQEEPNPINPIAGQAVLNWIRGKLQGTGYTTTEPAPEDWGWYMDAAGNGSSYLVGASGEPEPPGADIEWTIQVHKHRTLNDRLTGRNKMTSDDPLSALIERFIGHEAGFRDIDADKDA